MKKRSLRRLSDLAGAFGDLGVLFPLLAGLALFNGVDVQSSLALVGVTYLAAALVFRVPAPVQPLKVACSLALSLGLGAAPLRAAALEAGAILLLFAATGWIDRLARSMQKWVLRGMQLGVGLILIQGGWTLLMGKTKAYAPAAASGDWTHPSALWIALTLLVIPQIPVTLTNAAVGSADAARRYFGRLARRVTPSRLCVSMGLANLAMAAGGGIPVCHGSSGWTAHRRLGARSWRSTALLGAGLLVLSAVGRTRAMEALAAVPVPALAVLLIYVGLRHALLVRDVARFRAALLMSLGLGVLSWRTRNPALGMAAGVLLQVLWARRSIFKHVGVFLIKRTKLSFLPKTVDASRRPDAI